MVDVEKVAAAIHLVEDADNTWEPGDGGQALGPYQFHPGAFWDWAPEPLQGETWRSWFHRTIIRFLTRLSMVYPDMKENEMAVVFHQHCYIRRASAEDFTADDYVDRFRKAFGG